MADGRWWTIAALSLVLGLVLGGVVGYAAGSSGHDNARATVGSTPDTADEDGRGDASTDTGAMNNADVCDASDVAQALQVFGNNYGSPLRGPAVDQVHRAGDLFAQAAELAKGDVAKAFDHIAEIAQGVAAGDVYDFSAYNRVTSACAADGL